MIFLPTLIIISLATFALSKLAPGDPILLMNHSEATINGRTDLKNQQRAYQETAEQIGVDVPVFYGVLTSAAYPDTLYRIVQLERRETLSKLIAQYGNWEEIEDYYQQISILKDHFFNVPDSLDDAAFKTIRNATETLFITYKHEPIRAQFKKMNVALAKPTSGALKAILGKEVQQLIEEYATIRREQTPNQLYIPDLKWYGFNNQYHNWITSFFVGDFGTSYVDKRPVSHKLWDALQWTLIMNLLAILLAYFIAVPLGVLSAKKKDTSFDRISTIILFALFSLPNFWIATIMIFFFTSSHYGEWLNIFPAGGLGDLRSDAPFWDRFWETSFHLILPVICMTYTSLAFISRQMRGGILEVLGQDYIRTARAKGLGETKVVWKHAFRNSLFPIITLFASVFPAALAGSVVIEVIFNIPGMGLLAYSAILARDWPVVYTVLMLSAVLTMVGILVADLLYAASDPRVDLNK